MLGFAPVGSQPLGSTSSSTTSTDTTAPIFTGSLVQTAVTSISCTIDWSGTTHTDNVGITGYEYSVNGGIYYALGNVLSYTFTGFTASTTYTISLRAFDAAGNRSTVLSITTVTNAPSIDVTPPVMVGSLLSSAITSTSFNLSWQAATDNVAVTGYEASTDGVTYTNIGNVLTITETGLASAATYPCLVRAYDAAGNKSIPLSLSVTTLAAGTVAPIPPYSSSQEYFSASMNTPPLFVGEYGRVLNFNTQFDMSGYTSLNITFIRPDGTTFSPPAILGTVSILSPSETFLANQYCVYVFAIGDLNQLGTYTARVSYADTTRHLLTPLVRFNVQP